MDAFALLSEWPWVLGCMAFLLGLIAGSFINTLAHRLPLMLAASGMTASSEEAQPLKGGAGNASPASDPDGKALSLAWPPSGCPGCGHRLKAWELVPLLSYLMLRGKCSACVMHISPRYPITEALAGAMTLAVIYTFGATATGLLACALSWALLALARIDQDTGLLPDSITLPILWLGLGANLFPLFAPLDAAVIGAAAGYLSLWCIYWLFKLATGKEGMGHGDFKLLALIGAWLGWQALPPILLVASLTGLATGLYRLARGISKDAPYPFGPHLALAAYLSLLLH